MRRKTLAVLASLGIVAAALVAPAHATVASGWAELTTEDIGGTTEGALARTADGVLHVIWAQSSATDEELMHASISPGGIVSQPNHVADNWGFLEAKPDLIVTNTGTLRAFFGGSEPALPGGLWTSESTDGGASWSDPTLVENETHWGGAVGVEQDIAGTFYEATGNLLHAGLDATGPNSTYGTSLGTCCIYGSKLGEDLATGDIWNAFFMQGDSDGLFAQEVTPGTGAPAGEPIKMPGSSVTYNGDDITSVPVWHVPIAERVGGGVYVAMKAYTSYPSEFDRVLIWRIGDPDSYEAFKSPDSDDAMALAAAPDGRMWLAWVEGGFVYTSISNETVTAWSPPKKVKMFVADEYGENFGMTADATDAGVDIVANFGQVNLTGLFHSFVSAPPEWTSGDDVIEGTAAADYIYGGPGDDTLKSGGGKDEVYGGAGNDKLNGGPGKDKLSGGKGTDVCIFTKGDKMSGCEKKKRAH